VGYALHSFEELEPPFWLVQEQVVIVPPGGCHPVRNTSRKLLLVIGGECRHEVIGHTGPGSDVILREGDCLALPHRCEQRYRGVDTERGSRLHVVRLAYDPALLPMLSLASRPARLAEEPTTLTALAESCLQELRYFSAREAQSLQETLLQLTNELSRTEPDARQRLHALCASLTVLFARLVRGERVASGDSAPSDYLVSQTKVLLRTCLAEPVRLAELAAAVGVSEEHLARRFKQTTGTTVFGYLRRLRIERAKHYLATSEQNLSQIAVRVGFSSPTLFGRSFRDETGLTPSAYRKRLAREIG
jgi:AraC-like DNA-binding protein